MFSGLWKTKKQGSLGEQEKFKNTFKRIAQNAIYSELQCNDMTDKASSGGHFALAVLSEPIPNRQELVNTQVSPIFRFMKAADHEFLFIDLDFIEQKRNLVIGAVYSKETTKPFLVAAKTLGYFWFNDKSTTADGIQIPVVKPEMLEELLDEIPSK